MNTPVLILSVFALLTACVQPLNAQTPVSSESNVNWGSEFTLRLTNENQHKDVRISISVDGQSLDVRWNQAMESLFVFRDNDGDQALSPEESSRLPTSDTLHRLLWGSIALPKQLDRGWTDADTNNDNALSCQEMKTYFRRAGIGPQIAYGSSPTTKKLNQALQAQLGENTSQGIALSNLTRLEQQLSALDLNEDELLSPDELVTDLVYPGTTATASLLKSTAFASNISPAKAVRLVDTISDTQPFVASLSKTPNASQPVAAQTLKHYADQQFKISIRVDEGKLDATWQEVRQQAINQFEQADVSNLGYLEGKSLLTQNDICMKGVLDFADANLDGRLTRKELEAWLKLLDKLIQAQAMVSILDFDSGLFELIDQDDDGTISRRECRTSKERLTNYAREGDLQLHQLPHSIHITISPGLPKNALPIPYRPGPNWFRAMDRNEDGDISKREWNLAPAIFNKCDTDGDGFLSESEGKLAE